MNGLTGAALLLALALLAFPASPRRRLATAAAAPRPVGQVTRGAGGLVAGAAIACAAVVPVTAMLAAVVVALTVGLRYRRRRRIRRGHDEGRALEAALDVVVGELRVGSHPVRAFSAAAAETAGSVAVSLQAVAARARLGADVTAGLRVAAQSSARPAHWHRLAVCWQLASEHGLAIATLMRTAQRDIVECQRFSDRVSSAMAGARATAAILAGLPVLGVLLGQLIGADPLRFLLGGHAGGWLLVVGSALACAGLLWSDRIIQRAEAES